MGILFLGLGWAMPRTPPNPIFGVRTPRTLACAAALAAARPPPAIDG